jgi:putative hydrolase of the HAD superfamily
MITTVVFDLDDTLYDEVDYCRSGFTSVSEFLANLPGAPIAERIFDCFWKQFAAGNRTKTFNTALEELGTDYDEKLIRELVKVYRSHVPEITLPADSSDVLCRLSSKYTLALLTDGFLPAQQLKVQALGLEKYFKCIIYTEQLGRNCWKPSPAGFEKLMQTLNARPETISFVADNEKKDFIAPNKLGFLTVQVVRPARIHTKSSTETGAAARYIIHKISELPDLLEGL